MTNDNKQLGRTYRPLYQKENMFVSISHWCNILRLNRESGSFDSVSLPEMNGKGVYSIVMEVPYIYVGDHKNGEKFSVALRIVEIWFEPDVVVSPVAPPVNEVVHPQQQTLSQQQVVHPQHTTQVDQNGRIRQSSNVRPLMQHNY